jgi:hypothetical protein
MAGQLLLVNPGPKKGKTKKPRTAAQKAATAKMKRANAAKRKGKRRTTTVRTIMRTTQRNPIRGGSLLRSITSQATGAGVGAIGGALLDAILRPLPLTMKTGNVGHLTRAGIAIGAGLLGKRVPMLAQAAQGALTITLYNVLRQYVTVPMNLGEISDSDMQEIAGTDSYPDALGSYEQGLLGADGYGNGMGVYDGSNLQGVEY